MEMTDQLFSRGPEVKGLNEAQQELYREQLLKEGFAGEVMYELDFPVFKSTLLKALHQLMQEVPMKDERDIVERFMKEYEDFIVLIRTKDTGPFTEDQFRNLLVWTGHKPAIVSRQFVAAFQEAVQAQREYGKTCTLVTERPAHSYLERMVAAANN